MNTNEDICAIATGNSGAISILRISGDNAFKIGNAMWTGPHFNAQNARVMHLGKLGKDQVLGVCFKNPASYTGEDVIEFHTHGGSRPANAALKSALSHGCRMAEPGEFTFRAFVNGKMDLVQAEAVCDLINSQNDLAMNLAGRQLAGKMSEKFADFKKELLFALSECESRLDFPEENLDWDEHLIDRLAPLLEAINQLADTQEAGKIIRNGVKVVIAGRPNSGKSSLLNYLLGYERAIVTDIAGTTRDALEESVNLRNIPTRLIDTAGLRSDSLDKIENLGIERSKQHLNEAEVIFWMLDASNPDVNLEVAEILNFRPVSQKIIAVWNKSDLINEKCKLAKLPYPTVKISVLKSANLDELLDLYENQVWSFSEKEEPELAVNLRHFQHLKKCSADIAEAILNLNDSAFEIAAASLHDAVTQLDEITGETADPDVLGEIFSRFCIGK